MKAMAAAGRKFKIGEKPEAGREAFQLYHNELVYTNITGMITSDYGQIVYAAWGNCAQIHRLVKCISSAFGQKKVFKHFPCVTLVF